MKSISRKCVRWMGILVALAALTACSSTPDKPVADSVTKKPVAAKIVKKPAPLRETYVGIEIPPIPNSHEIEMGYLLQPNGPHPHAIEIVKIGTKKFVWMGRLLYNDEQGKAHWKIIAATPPHPLPVGYHFSTGNCLNQGEHQPEIVAIVKREDKPQWTQVQKAWKANTREKAFEELPVQGISCINQDWKRL